MQLRNTLNLLDPLNSRLQALEQTISQRGNMLAFLVVRFVLMSGMVVGFSWWFLHLSP
jgi:predicted Na+-dependent transporter